MSPFMVIGSYHVIDNHVPELMWEEHFVIKNMSKLKYFFYKHIEMDSRFVHNGEEVDLRSLPSLGQLADGSGFGNLK